jgi:hypothetical protein
VREIASVAPATAFAGLSVAPAMPIETRVMTSRRVDTGGFFELLSALIVHPCDSNEPGPGI